MCKLVPVLRVIGFVFLVLAIVCCAIGFVVPYWIRLPLDDEHGETTTLAAPGGDQVAAVALRSTTESTPTSPPTTSGMGLPDALSGLMANGSYRGLWASCFHNFSCKCFWQNNFAMEKSFPGTEYLPCTVNAGVVLLAGNTQHCVIHT